MKKTDISRKWRPGWPWELEVLAFIFAVSAAVIPLYVFYAGRTPTPEQPLNFALPDKGMLPATDWDELVNVFWAIGIVGLYLVHLILAGGTIQWISTPFTHLAAPFIFSMIAYFRMVHFSQNYPQYAFLAGSPAEFSFWILGVLCMTWLLARMRMARHLARFRDDHWDVVTPTALDWSYLELITFFRPIVYPPRQYKLNRNGLLIEGWWYAMSVPIEVIQHVEAVSSTQLVSYGFYLATSRHSLIKIRLSEPAEPIFISPKDREQFVHFALQVLESRRPATEHGQTRHGTRHGIARSADSQGQPSKAQDSP